ncbi:MAG: PD40 domain-containing protein [Armatimonadetes bacterium]|nr:PD40 domain-containing protein [Armatimonadota bacterium]
MSLIPILIITAYSPGQLPTAAPHKFVGMRSLALSPDGSNLAFSYRGDIWVVPSGGGRAIALTTNVEEDDKPVWSPDGKWIAFASDREGSWDIFAVPVEGGETARLTYSSQTEIPSSWVGDKITMDAGFDKGVGGIYTLDPKTLKMGEVWLTNFRLDSPMFSPDGSKIAFTHKAMFPYFRPRYEGSGAAQLWMINSDGSGRKPIRSTGFQHLWPQWSPDGSKLYAVTVSEKTPSSHRIGEKPPMNVDNAERTPNVYEIDMAGKARRLTDFVGFAGTRFLTVAAESGTLAFEDAGEVYVMQPGGKPAMVTITGAVDPKGQNFERQVITTGVEEAALSPDMKTVAFGIQRELFSVPVTKGKGPNGADAKQLTNYAGSDGSPVYSPDGKTLYFTSDRDGANSIYTMDVATGEIKPFYKAPNEVAGLEVTPDKKNLTFWENGRQGGFMMIPLGGGAAKRLLDKPYVLPTAISPDMKYLAYTKPLIGSGFKPWENGNNVWVKDIATGKEVNVTKLNAQDSNPAWSADGKYLYFTSDRGPAGIFVVPSQKEEARATELDLKFEKPEGTPKVDFDMDRPDDRIRFFLAGGGPIKSDPTNGDVFYTQGGEVWKAGYNGEGATQVTRGGVRGGYEFSSDSNQIFTIMEGNPVLVNLRRPGFPMAKVELRAEWIRDVTAEHRAAFHEFWRIYNNQFYDEYFHRRDWAAIRDHYEPLLDSVGHRRDMSEVLNQMVGELESSHSEVSPAFGGPRGGDQSSHPGFTIDYSYQGPGLKVKDVPENTPGSFAKTQIKPGEYVMKINGVTVWPDQNLFKVLNNQTGRDMTFTVNSKPSTDGAREVTYRAMNGGQFGQILYENRIEWRRKYVEELSGGKVTYVHIAGMGDANLNRFNAEMWEYVQGKEGVIVDVRENGGGNIADLLIDMLERKLHMRYIPRDGDEIPGPGMMWDKPMVVMAAETSFSNAEMFPQTVKTLGLAKLVGMPTPGYVIYTYGGRLVDGTSIRLPSTGVYRVDGTPLENWGVEPDIKVDIDPDQYFRNEDPQLKRAVEEVLRQIGARG